VVVVGRRRRNGFCYSSSFWLSMSTLGCNWNKRIHTKLIFRKKKGVIIISEKRGDTSLKEIKEKRTFLSLLCHQYEAFRREREREAPFI